MPRSTPPSRRGHVPLIAGALVGWFALLWLGVVLLGDAPGRSALMAGIVVALATVGRIVSGRGGR